MVDATAPNNRQPIPRRRVAVALRPRDLGGDALSPRHLRSPALGRRRLPIEFGNLAGFGQGRAASNQAGIAYKANGSNLVSDGIPFRGIDLLDQVRFRAINGTDHVDSPLVAVQLFEQKLLHCQVVIAVRLREIASFLKVKFNQAGQIGQFLCAQDNRVRHGSLRSLAKPSRVRALVALVAQPEQKRDAYRDRGQRNEQGAFNVSHGQSPVLIALQTAKGAESVSSPPLMLKHLVAFMQQAVSEPQPRQSSVP